MLVGTKQTPLHKWAELSFQQSEGEWELGLTRICMWETPQAHAFRHSRGEAGLGEAVQPCRPGVVLTVTTCDDSFLEESGQVPRRQALSAPWKLPKPRLPPLPERLVGAEGLFSARQDLRRSRAAACGIAGVPRASKMPTFSLSF